MTATAHALIGASLAVKIANPLIGIPLAVISHFIADLIPHWDEGTNHNKKSILRLRIEALADVILGFLLVLIIFRSFAITNPVYLFSMVIAAQLPDWLETPFFMFGIKIPLYSTIDWISHNLQTRMQLPWGLVTQVAVVIVMIIFAISPQEVTEVLALNF
jgi:hypothetical protein